MHRTSRGFTRTLTFASLRFVSFFVPIKKLRERYDQLALEGTPAKTRPTLVSGFTLIELLVVIAIIGMLASIIMASLNSARVKARDARRVSDIRQIRVALELYYADFGQYPISGGATSPNNSWSNSTDGSWTTLQTALAPYIPHLSTDPQQSASGWGYDSYSYSYYSQAYGCSQQWYMFVWHPEVSSGFTSPGVRACDGTTFNYGNGSITEGVGR